MLRLTEYFPPSTKKSSQFWMWYGSSKVNRKKTIKLNRRPWLRPFNASDIESYSHTCVVAYNMLALQDRYRVLSHLCTNNARDTSMRAHDRIVTIFSSSLDSCNARTFSRVSEFTSATRWQRDFSYKCKPCVLERWRSAPLTGSGLADLFNLRKFKIFYIL